MPDRLVKIYDLTQDHRKINLIREVGGFISEHGTFLSPQWLRAVKENLIPMHTVEGIISRVYMSGHNDYPEFEIDDEQEKTQWTRDGRDEAYVVGRCVKLKYVLQKPKKVPSGVYPFKIVLEIWLNIDD